MIRWFSKHVVYFITGLLIIGLAFSVDNFFMQKAEKRQDYVELNSSQNVNRTIVFYKDDCNFCQEVFPFLYHQQQFFQKNIVFVNLNNNQNRKYISKYGLETVPTVVREVDGNIQKYAGINKDEIKKILNKED